MLLEKENARRMWKSGRATHKSKASVPRRMTEREGLALVALFAALFAWMLLDMAVFA